MDLSKLPKLSQTTPPPPQPAPPPPQQPPRRPPAQVATAGAWISIGVGVILLLAYPRLLQFVSARLFDTAFAPYIDPITNQQVPYTAQLDFWSDLGITLFALVLILDGLVAFLLRRPMALLVTLALTLATTLYNLSYLVTTYTQHGLPLVSAMAVVFGAYIAWGQWEEYRSLRQAQSPDLV